MMMLGVVTRDMHLWRQHSHDDRLSHKEEQGLAIDSTFFGLPPTAYPPSIYMFCSEPHSLFIHQCPLSALCRPMARLTIQADAIFPLPL
jgi:hypothetical protein